LTFKLGKESANATAFDNKETQTLRLISGLVFSYFFEHRAKSEVDRGVIQGTVMKSASKTARKREGEREREREREELEVSKEAA
jgi:hypothetical protein